MPILVRSRLKSEGVVQCGYVKNDGERFMLTILTDNRSMDETMWVFERKDLPYGRAGCSMDVLPPIWFYYVRMVT